MKYSYILIRALPTSNVILTLDAYDVRSELVESYRLGEGIDDGGN
jgi:hypothetical protein